MTRIPHEKPGRYFESGQMFVRESLTWGCVSCGQRKLPAAECQSAGPAVLGMEAVKVEIDALLAEAASAPLRSGKEA